MPLAILLIAALFIQAPAGWDATLLRGQRLIMDKKTADAIKLFEGVLKTSPTFDGAHYALADAHHMAALQATLLAPSQDTARRQHLEAAATHFRHAADRPGNFQQLAVRRLMSLYDEDELNQPREVVTFARQYILLNPASPFGHITLARALKATGQEAAATTAFLEARTAVPAADAQFLAMEMVNYAVQTQSASTADLKAMLDYSDVVIDQGLKEYPKDRQLIIARGASAMFRGQRLETDPARKRALDAEARRMMDRLYALRDDSPVATPSAAPVGFREPEGYAAAHTQAEGMMSRKQFAAAAAVYEKFVKSNPEFVAAHYLRVQALVLAGQGATIDQSLKAARQAIPATPEVRQLAASYEFDIVGDNKSIKPADAKKLLTDAMLLLDDALKARPQYWEAVAYQSAITRKRAVFETDPAVIKSLIAEADRLLAQAEALRKK